MYVKLEDVKKVGKERSRIMGGIPEDQRLTYFLRDIALVQTVEGARQKASSGVPEYEVEVETEKAPKAKRKTQDQQLAELLGL